MKNARFNFVMILSLVVTSLSFGQTNMISVAEMYPTKNIVENAVNSKDHTTLVAAVKAADLVETLSSDGPFTVFAAINKAFDALPKGTLESLQKLTNKAKLQEVLTYHIIAGDYKTKDVVAAIKKEMEKLKSKPYKAEL